MNPFLWSGPAFLLFYVVLGFLLLLTLHLWLRREGMRAPQNFSLLAKDPYRIAYLRGGASEAIKIATISLIDRRFLRTEWKRAQITNLDALKMVKVPLEIAVLKNYYSLQTVHYLPMQKMRDACNDYHEELQDLGFLLTPKESRQRWKLAAIVIACLLTVSVTKLAIALERGRHNVLLLVALTTLLIGLAIWLTASRRSVAGDVLLKDLQVFFHRLKERVAKTGPGSEGDEAMLMAAVFGAEYLPYSRYPFVSKLYPSKGNSGGGGGNRDDGGCGSGCSSSSDSSSSCSSGGSSCSSSSCGGGSGCGGCGGGGD